MLEQYVPETCLITEPTFCCAASRSPLRAPLPAAFPTARPRLLKRRYRRRERAHADDFVTTKKRHTSLLSSISCLR